MRTSQAGLDLIKAFEGFRARSELLPNGRWVIGYGHLRGAKEGVAVNETEAEAILREYDLPPIERFVMRCVLAPLTQNEFDALVSFAFNIGAKPFSSSDVVASINGGNRLDAAAAFDHWRRAKIGGRVQTVDALVRRRAAEKALFLNAPGRMPIASSRLYRAMHDREALPAPPKSREILVEHTAKPDPINMTQSNATDPSQTATEAAAESVREQMVRILGEDHATPAAPADQMDGTTPEEIAAAVSELAGDQGDASVQKSVWPSLEDLPPPPFPDPESGPDSFEQPCLEPLASSEIIDDLEEVEVSQESIERAVEIDESLNGDHRSFDLIGALPFGLLALIGFMLSGYGIATQFGAIQSDQPVESSLAVYLPPFLMLLGALLFLVMLYYFLRALLTKD